MLSVPVCCPVEVGENVTLTVHVAAAASELQVVVASNGAVACTLKPETVVLPVFVSVTV